MSCHPSLNQVLHRPRAPRALAWRTFGVILGLITASLGTIASAEPAAQAATATPTPSPTTGAAVPCAPAQGIVLILEAPNPGAVISSGANVVIQGIAYDSGANADNSNGIGIDRVTAYFGDRDTGGIFWGNAVLGQPNPLASSGPLATAGFTLRSPTIPAGSGSRSIFVYAHSSVTDREAIASVPVFLGVPPTAVKGQVPTAVLPPPPVCTPAPTATPVSTSTSTPVPTFTPAVSAPTATRQPTVALPAPAAPAPAAPAPALPAPAAPAAAPAPAAPLTVAPATATTAPRGGGIPREFGLLLFAAGAIVVGGGFVARRREHRGRAPRA